MNFIVKTRCILAIALLCTMPLQATYASSALASLTTTLADVVQAVKETKTEVVKAIDGIHDYLEKRIKENYEQDHYGFDQNAAENLESAELNKDVQSRAASKTNKLTGEIIGPETEQDWDTRLASRMAGDSYSPSLSAFDAATRKKAMSDVLCGANNFTLDSLVGPVSYETKYLMCDDQLKPDNQKHNQAEYASSFIEYASNLDKPFATINIPELLSSGSINKEEATRLASSFEYRDYTAARRSLMALQATATSNLDYLFEQRVALHDDKGNKISPSALEAQYKIATKRTGSKEWYDNMKTALPKVLIAEAVNILAEMQANLMLMREEDQRLLATSSVILLRDIQMDKMVLKMKTRDIDQLVKRYQSGRQAAEEQALQKNRRN